LPNDHKYEPAERFVLKYDKFQWVEHRSEGASQAV
jgi:hypothetical protein